MQKKVAIVGAASSKFGELWESSPRSLVSSVVNTALCDAGVSLGDIDVLFVGNMLSGVLGNQENLGALFADELSLTVPAIKIEGACASGGLAVHCAFVAVASGQYETALVVGVEKMTDHKPEEVSLALMGAGSELERLSGLTFPGLYALIARSYIKRYSLSQKELASVAVKNHFHALMNPNAHFHLPLTTESVLNSPMIADPLRLFDCSPISDGAAALVISSNKRVLKKQHPVWIIGSAAATDTLSLANRKDLTSLSASVKAADYVYKHAGITPSDIDVAEVHDCFTIAEIIALEDLGIFKKGTAGKRILQGAVTCDGGKHLVVNTSGGLKACGHPIGATGVKQAVEIVDQLLGRCHKRQVANARIGLTHNVGGSGAIAVVHALAI